MMKIMVMIVTIATSNIVTICINFFCEIGTILISIYKWGPDSFRASPQLLIQQWLGRIQTGYPNAELVPSISQLQGLHIVPFLF